MRRIKILGLVLILTLFSGCLQVQLYGPVAGANVTVTELRSASTVVNEAESWADGYLRETFGDEQWDSFSALLKFLFYGVLTPGTGALDDDALYLVTASAGSDVDAGDRNGLPDEVFTPVQGEWRAIMTGAQLKSVGAKVSALTEAAYLWIQPELGSLDDIQVTYNLDRLAQSLLLDDLSGDQRIDAWDLLLWSRSANADALVVSENGLDAIADSVIAGGDDASRSLLADSVISLAVSSERPNTDTPAGQLRQELRGLVFDAFLEASYDAILLRHPEWIVELGLSGYELDGNELNNVSDAYTRETYDIVEVILEQLLATDRGRLSDAQQLSYDIYRWHLEDWLAEEEFMLFDYPASSFITSVPRQTLFFFTDIQPLATARDASDYLARLARVDDKFSQLRQAVAARAQVGIIEPAVTLSRAIDYYQSLGNTSATASDYYTRLEADLPGIGGLTGAQRAALLSEARGIIETQVLPAYRALRQDLAALSARAPAAIGFGQFEGGEAFYQYALQHHTTTNMTAEEIHQLGLAELARVQAEVQAAAVALGYQEGLGIGDIFFQVYGDAGVLVGNAIVRRYEDLIDFAYTRIDEAFDQLPEQELVVIGGQTGGFYVAGSEDGSRPGAFYARAVGEESYYTMPTIAFHEGLPGHHLQIALAQEQQLPAFQRYTTFTGYVEGWGLYAERLAYELGWYDDDPFGNLGRLYWEGIRAARLVVDTGIHHYGWTWQQSIDFLVENTGMPDFIAPGSVARFMRWPGQATAYMTGLVRMLELREQYRSARGADYNIKAFHNLVLLNGSMPLPVLQQVVDDATGN